MQSQSPGHRLTRSCGSVWREFTARPAGGKGPTAPAWLPGRGGAPPSGDRNAVPLGMAAATGFGFVAAVIKELSAHLSQGPSAVFLNWSPYVVPAWSSSAGAPLCMTRRHQLGQSSNVLQEV